MVEPADPLDAGLLIADAMKALGVSYALGGALAYGLWGIPRATVDVDLNVFVAQDGLEPVFAALRSVGVTLDELIAVEQNARDGAFTARFGQYRVDVFSASVDFSWEAERTRVLRRIDGRDVWFLSAEALAVFKLLFFRPKDLVDLQRLIAVQGSRLDRSYVRRHMAGMVGAHDVRVVKWDELVAAHGDP